jgi:hypothetical protein
MRFDKKADIGFPEAIMAVMMVTIVLTVYLGAFVINSQTDNKDHTEFDQDIVSEITIVENVLIGDINEKLYIFMEKNELLGVTVRCWAPGNIVECDLSFTIGVMDGNVEGKRFIKTIPTDDGRMIPVIFEVAQCF